jgi:hypothetical protein
MSSVSSKHLIKLSLNAVDRVDLDDFGIEYVTKDADRVCGACESPYRCTHGGYGSVCYDCGEPWFDGSFVEGEEEEE